MQYNTDVYKSYFQTDAWAAFKQKSGWAAERIDDCLVLTRKIGFGQSMRYLPELPYEPTKLSYGFKPILGLNNRGIIFTRLEFLEAFSPEKADELEKLGLIKSFEDVQPEWRQWVDLSGSEDEILAAMKPKGRYNIGLAERAGLELVTGGSELVADFFKLYAFTANRTDFKGRGPKYFEQLIEALGADTEILLIKKDERVLAGAIILYYDQIASYLYGGSQSVNEGDRSLMAPYLLQWESIKRAKARGCSIYDLLAVAPEGSGEDHPYAGITRFKSRFGGQTVQLLGSYDLVHKRFWYTLYRFAERLRRKKNTS